MNAWLEQPVDGAVTAMTSTTKDTPAHAGRLRLGPETHVACVIGQFPYGSRAARCWPLWRSSLRFVVRSQQGFSWMCRLPSRSLCTGRDLGGPVPRKQSSPGRLPRNALSEPHWSRGFYRLANRTADGRQPSSSCGPHGTLGTLTPRARSGRSSVTVRPADTAWARWPPACRASGSTRSHGRTVTRQHVL